jgi:hypothetical protein
MTRTESERVCSDDFDEALAAYALAHRLEEVSPGLLSHHLSGCDPCRRRLKTYVKVAAEIGLTARPRRPPMRLLRRIALDMAPDSSIVDVREHAPASMDHSTA